MKKCRDEDYEGTEFYLSFRISRFSLTCALCLVVAVTNGCLLFTCDLPGIREYGKINQIPRKDPATRSAEYNKLPIAMQVNVYICAIKCSNPSDVVFLEYLVENGESKVTPLARELDKRSDPWDKLIILDAVLQIDRECKCVSSDATAMSIFERNEDLLNDEANGVDWRTDYRTTLESFHR